MNQRIIISIFCLLVLGGCLEDPDCYQLNNNIVGISFKKLYDKKADTLAIVDITAPGTDSVFYSYKLATGVYLPLNFLAEETDFTFNTFDQVPETRALNLSFNSKTQFVSLDCGVRYILDNLKITGHDFDSVRVLSNVPGNAANTTNLEIYRCPNNTILKIKFRQVVDGKILADTVYLNSITTDYSWNIAYAEPSEVTQLKIPLNADADITTYNFEFEGKTNTLQLGYTRTQRLLFDVCGNQMLLSNLDTILHDFDSIRIINDTIQDPPVTNLEIFH